MDGHDQGATGSGPGTRHGRVRTQIDPGAALRDLINEQAGDPAATAVTVLFSTIIYFVFGLGFLLYLGFAWNWLPGPLLFLILCDLVFTALFFFIQAS